MDIAQMAMTMSQTNVKTSFQYGLMKMEMSNTTESNTEILDDLAVSTKEMEQSINPDLGTTIDVVV